MSWDRWAHEAVEQGTPEWHSCRIGKVTASRVHDVVTTLKNGSYGKGRDKYLKELVWERMTQTPAAGFSPTAAMRWGLEYEPQARAHFSFLYDAEIRETAFVDHPEIKGAGMSPDGYFARDKSLHLVEIKCPQPAAFIEYLESREIPQDYYNQMMWQMACDKSVESNFFFAYHPDLEDGSNVCIELARDDDYISYLESTVEEFIREVDERVFTLQNNMSA